MGAGWLDSVLECSSEVVKVVDPDGTLRYASPAFGRVFGHHPDGAVGTMNVLDHVHPDDLPHVLEETEKALAEGRDASNRAEYRFRHADGSWRWVESVGTFLLDDPQVRGVVVTSRDVTRRKEAEEALRRSEAELFSVLESITDAFFALDREWRFTYVNAQAEDLFSNAREVLIGEKIWEDPTFYPHYRRAVEEGTTVRFEARYPPGGTWYSVRAYPSASGLSVYLQDITERKEAEEALRESERRFASVVSNAHAYAYRCLNEPGYPNEYASGYALELTGYPPEDLLVGGKVKLGDLIIEEDRDRVWEEVQEALAEGQGFELEYAIRRKDGQIRHVHEYGRAVRDEGGGVVALEGLLYDVTERKEAEDRLREAEERYRTLVERMPAVTYVQQATAPEAVTYVSPQMEDLLGYEPEECTSDPQHWVKVIHPEDRERVLAEEERSNETGEPFSMEYRQFAKDGRVVWVRDDATLVRGKGGEPLYWLGVQTDVTESRVTEAKLQEAEASYRSLVERVPVAIYRQEIEHDGAVSYISPQIEAITGYAPEEYADPDLWIRTMHPEDRQRVLDEDERTDKTGEPFMAEFRKTTKDGRLTWLRDEAVLVRDAAGEPLYWQGVVSDITERKALEERLEHQALHDPLTRLPNRRLFVDRLGQALGRTRRKRSRVAVLFMDLDGFKNVNDSLGHDVGDLLLSVVAQRLRRCLRPEDALARFGGDEFVVLIEDVDDAAGAVQVAERITGELRWPFRLEGRELYVDASIGVSLGDAQTHAPEVLIREADTAMYRAKEAGGGFRVFDPSMHERALGRLELENDLRRAVERGEFVVHYQPIVNLRTGELWGTEALVRWEHPVRGLLNPDEFVPIAEESGLVVPMGEQVLQEACVRAKEWQRDHPQMPSLVMSVNLSARQLKGPDLADVVEGALRRTGLEARCLVLDVTETVYVRALEGHTEALSRLRAMGVGISIDDFGTGYSSLAYLKRLPADALKIDKSFVRGLGEDTEDTAIVGMIVELAHTLGMEVIAEGVETEGQAEVLREMGCDFSQGFHFSGPLPPEAVSEFLAD